MFEEYKEFTFPSPADCKSKGLKTKNKVFSKKFATA
jgi:hypothetical protein